MGSDTFDEGAVLGFVNGLRSFISPTNQTQQQQQQTAANPAQTQQPPNNTTNPASALTATPLITGLPSGTSNQLSPGTYQYPFNLPSPTSGGTSSQNNDKQLDPFNGASPISPPPIYSTLSGGSVPQIANDANPEPLQMTPNSVLDGISLPSYSPGDLSYIRGPNDSNTHELPGSHPDREPSENRGEEDGGDDVLMEDVDVRSIKRFVYPPSVSTSETISTCRFEGCSNSAFVDSITDLESEYCSWKHQEWVPFSSFTARIGRLTQNVLFLLGRRWFLSRWHGVFFVVKSRGDQTTIFARWGVELGRCFLKSLWTSRRGISLRCARISRVYYQTFSTCCFCFGHGN